MDYWLITSNQLSIKQLLNSLSQETLSDFTKTEKIQIKEFKKNHLYKDRDNKKILYISGVAQQLAKSHNCTAMEIANTLVPRLLATSGDVFMVTIVPPGWIYFELKPTYLASWLQNWVMGCREQLGKMGTENTTPKFNNYNPSHIFAIQHAYARCCSLILLGHREKLIKLREPLPDTSTTLWQPVSQQPIPWLNHDNLLWLHHSTERDLLAQLVEVVDELVCSEIGDAIHWQKTAWKLSQAWEKFWCQCRIWGDVKINSPELAQSRLGLVIVTQHLLRYLLVEKLGVSAVWEL
ncbi:glutamate acetyltransferase [Nostoc sp. FACHB-190]|nr:glutamate acetyltransferase [Nostoc sp. FACHB-190]